MSKPRLVLKPQFEKSHSCPLSGIYEMLFLHFDIFISWEVKLSRSVQKFTYLINFSCLHHLCSYLSQMSKDAPKTKSDIICLASAESAKQSCVGQTIWASRRSMDCSESRPEIVLSRKFCQFVDSWIWKLSVNLDRSLLQFYYSGETTQTAGVWTQHNSEQVKNR